MAGIRNETLYGDNVDFSGATIPAPTMVSDGQLLIAATAAPNIRVGNITSTGGSIVVTNGPGTINLETQNAGTVWQVVTTPQGLSDNDGFFANDAGVVTFTLPMSSSVGDTYQIVAMSVGGWSISQNGGQQITVGGLSTTLGAAGSISSTAQGDWIELVCNVANTNWIACVKEGMVTVV